MSNTAQQVVDGGLLVAPTRSKRGNNASFANQIPLPLRRPLAQRPLRRG